MVPLVPSQQCPHPYLYPLRPNSALLSVYKYDITPLLYLNIRVAN